MSSSRQWWRLLIGTADSSLERSQRPTDMAGPPTSRPSLSPGCPFTKIQSPSTNGNIVIVSLSAHKRTLLKNKLLCLHLMSAMPFVRLHRSTGTSLSRDKFFKSHRVCNGRGTTRPGEAEVVLTSPTTSFPCSAGCPSAHYPMLTLSPRKNIIWTIPSVNCPSQHRFSGVLSLIIALT